MKIVSRLLMSLSALAIFSSTVRAEDLPKKAEPKVEAKPDKAPDKNVPEKKVEKKNDAVTPAPRDGGWVKRHEGFNETVKKGNIDLLFIGDSITDGWRGKKAIWEKSFGKYKPVNLGIGGDRTQHVLWRLENGNIEGLAPKAAVLMIGTNNSGNNSPEDIAAGVTAIVKKLNEKLPKTKVLVLAIFPRGADKTNKNRIVNEKANAIIAKLADGKQVFYLDIGPKFLAEDGTLSKEIMPDLLHLSDKGYQIWADAITADLAKLMEDKN